MRFKNTNSGTGNVWWTDNDGNVVEGRSDADFGRSAHAHRNPEDRRWAEENYTDAERDAIITSISSSDNATEGIAATAEEWGDTTNNISSVFRGGRPLRLKI